MTTQFVRSILEREKRLAMLIGVYAGLQITGASIKQAVTDGNSQAEAVLAMHARYQTDVLLTAMDLSAEAEAFGCTVQISDDEIPSVTGSVTADIGEAHKLAIPAAGSNRTAVHLEAARKLATQKAGVVLGGCIGPFSLAALLMGVNEALRATIADAAILHTLLEKTTSFLIEYMGAFREAGAGGVIMAEPTAGLLSPAGMGTFSSPYVKRLVEVVQHDDFTLIYHNCGARMVHLPKVLEAGASVYHFGKPMDMTSALGAVDSEIVLGGNIDPAGVFRYGLAQDVEAHTSMLLKESAAYKNYFIASGCDLPPGIPVENMDIFYATIKRLDK
jgi:uroporphyrinogen decarboxylase